MIKYLPLLLLGLFPTLSPACECSFGPLDDAAVRAANRIFVFQLAAAEVISDGKTPPISRQIQARIRVVDQLKGAAPGTLMDYSTLWCCGSKLNIGHYYAAFLADDETTFFGHAGNLLQLGETYRDGSHEAQRLRSVVDGTKALEAVYGKYPSSSIEIIPPPPPPCPPQAK